LLGDAYNSTKEYAKSDSSFEQALRIMPTDATTLNNYAYYLSLRKERLNDAEKMSKKSLELQPNSKSFLDTYGWILFQQGNYQDAKKYIEKAISIDDEDNGTLYDHLGDVYYKLNHTEKALEYWLKAKQAGENSPTLLKKINDKKWYE
jgi:Tfp pilus assembly protein PilF